jgi:hypothetical protein
MSLSAKRLQRRIATDTARWKVHLSGQLPWDVIGMVDDLPIAGDDPAAIQSAVQEGPPLGARPQNQHHDQRAADGAGASFRRESRR